MNKRILTVCLLCTICIFLKLRAQESFRTKENFISFNPQFFQVKDKFNYGLAHSGLNLNLGYAFVRTTDKNTISYSPDLAFGANYKQGVGLAWHFRPIDLYYGINLTHDNTKIIILGPYFATNYNWQLYPELQSGHMFWFTSIEAGPRLLATIPFKSKIFKLTVTNSLAGWTSRPRPATETYFYSLQFSDFVNNAHSDLTFGSYDRFNHTILEIDMLPKQGKRLSLGYQFEYFGYFHDPKLSYLSHSLILKWKTGKI